MGPELTATISDRFAGMWVLAATTGMRRSELAAVDRTSLDLQRGLITIADTRVVVDGHTMVSDGKSASGRRRLALDAFTVAALRDHVAMLDAERVAAGRAHRNGGALMCWPDGRRLHPESITDRFNRLVDHAGVRRIRLHDVRHTYATLALDAGVDVKILSDRLGHANPAVTLHTYSHHSTGRDRPAAELLAGLIQTALQRARGNDQAT